MEGRDEGRKIEENKICACNQIQEIYTRTNLLELCRGRFSLDKTNLSLLYYHLNPL